MKLNGHQKALLDFVKSAHSGQLRKYTGEEYWTHPYAVAEIVQPYDDGTNMLIEIALLHDVVEDTPTTIEQIFDHLLFIGYSMGEARAIEMGVIALTDQYTTERFDHMNRSLRKQFEATRLSKIHPDFQTVKYADLIHNTGSIVEYDWGFAKKYLPEKRHILSVMRNGDLDLFIECYSVLKNAERYLEANLNETA